MAELRACGVAVSVAPCQPWLTERGHLDPLVRDHAPAEIVDVLDEIHGALGGDHRVLSHRRRAPLPTGLRLAETGQLVAVDGVEHFTVDRLRSLGLYPAATVFGFDLDHYRGLIERWRQRASAVFTRRWSPDFDFVGGRRAHRAYEDALRDLLTPVFTGLPLLRVASPDGDVCAAVGTILAAPTAA